MKSVNLPISNICVLVALIVFSSSAYSQTADGKPLFKLECPDAAAAGDTFPVTAKTNAKISGTAAYRWHVSGGVITKGKGTRAIEIQIDENTESVAVSFEMKSGSIEQITASCTVNVYQQPKARKLDEFPFFNQGYIKMKLDGTLFQELGNDPTALGYIFIFPKTNKERAIIERIIRNQIRFRGVDLSRITIAKGGQNSRSVLQFWLVPAGAETPVPVLETETR